MQEKMHIGKFANFQRRSITKLNFETWGLEGISLMKKQEPPPSQPKGNNTQLMVIYSMVVKKKNYVRTRVCCGLNIHGCTLKEL